MILNKTLKIGLALAAAALLAAPAMDGDITDSLYGVSGLITMICYPGALVFGVIGVVKWKAYSGKPPITQFKVRWHSGPSL